VAGKRGDGQQREGPGERGGSKRVGDPADGHVDEAEQDGKQDQPGQRRRLDLLYLAPERLRSESALQLLDRGPVALFAIDEKLRAWRAAAAKEQGVPAYVIFHDATLCQIAALASSTLTQLAAVSGVGEAKLARYGQQILDVLGG